MNAIAILSLAVLCAFTGDAIALAPPLTHPIGLSDFSGHETLVPFATDFAPSDSYTVDAVKFTNIADSGFLLAHTGGQIQFFFSNIPGASLGTYGRTTGVGVMQMQIDLPSPANRFGMLLAGGDTEYTVTAISNDNPLGSVVVKGLFFDSIHGSATFAGIGSDVPFDRVTVIETAPNGSADAFDDVRFEFAPEPSTTALLVIGCVVALVARRR